MRVAYVLPMLLISTALACRGERGSPASGASASGALSSSASNAASASGGANPPTSGWQVVDEGRPPRAPIAFAFVPGRTESRVAEIDNQVEHAGAPPTSDRLKIRFEVHYSAADAFELQVKQLGGTDATGAEVPRIATTVGAFFKLKIVDGALVPVEAKFPDGASPPAQSYLESAMGVITPMLLPMVPTAPVGEGGRWRPVANDGPTHTLLSRTSAGVVVEEHGELRGARRRERTGFTRVNEDLSVRIESPLDGIAHKVDGTVVQERTRGGKHTTHVLVTDAPP